MTTIHVSNKILSLLKELRRKMGLKTYNEVITELVLRVENMPRSLFGSNPKLKPFTEKDRTGFHEL